MATIYYTFSDGHVEKIEVTEEFARIYTRIEEASKRNDWKFDFRNRKLNTSLEHLTTKGFDILDDHTDVESEYLVKEFEDKLLPLLTDKQRQIYDLYYIKGYQTREIAERLHITQPAVMAHLKGIEKKYLKNFR